MGLFKARAECSAQRNDRKISISTAAENETDSPRLETKKYQISRSDRLVFTQTKRFFRIAFHYFCSWAAGVGSSG